VELGVQEILEGPDFFKCERFSVRMKKRACIDRQVKKRMPGLGQYNFLECLDCPQGKNILKEKGQIIKTETLKRLKPRPDGSYRKESNAMTEKKVCINCGKEKCLDDFPRNKVCKDGHTNQCKACRREYQNTHNAKKGKKLLTSPVVVSAPVVRQAPNISDVVSGGDYNAAAALFIQHVEKMLVDSIINGLKD
jgi:hypothetical protein